QAEPGGLAAGRRLLDRHELLMPGKCRGQPGVVSPAGGGEAIDLLQLLPADGGLQVERLQVVAEVAVDVLVVVAVGEFAQLPAEALAAGVVLAAGAPAVTAPVAERLRDPPQPTAARQHRPSLA